MALKIPNADRIVNKNPPLDPNDKSELNADNVMLIFDNLVNGAYRFRVRTGTYEWIAGLPDKLEGEVFFAVDVKQFLGWDGEKLVILG